MDKFYDVSAKGEMAGVDEPQMILMGGLRLSQPTVNHRLGERTLHHISATPTNVKTNRPMVGYVLTQEKLQKIGKGTLDSIFN